MARFERRGFGGRSFGRSFGPRDDIPKPVKVGEEYEVEISEVGSRGDGIARVKNFVVFVNGAKQGEKTKIRITEVRNRFATGEKVGEASAAKEVEVEKEAESTEEPEEVEVEKEVKPEELTEEVVEESEAGE